MHISAWYAYSLAVIRQYELISFTVTVIVLGMMICVATIIFKNEDIGHLEYGEAIGVYFVTPFLASLIIVGLVACIMHFPS